MATRMLIDATHPEETRVVVVDGSRLEEFDFETSTKKQLKGNIYLAKVTRVEPSLQAAFVDYGGNRDGFLPFNDIHPDYYQIPIADRQALLEQQAADEAADDAAEEAARDGAGDGAGTADAEAGVTAHEEAAGDAIEDVGGDELEELSRARGRALRRYKIQEVIKRRRILLVQVVKEERGSKGAALTTYLSLAGRYCVLMPNTARGGGISRKIVSPADRKRLKDIVESFEVPKGMGVIVRTAGMNRTKPEVKRDFEYLLKLWDEIRETTLNSTAPTLVYEEANLIKRSIRDLYNKDIGEILVGGDAGYRAAKSFMRMLVPSRAKVVQPYRDRIPLFRRYKVEEQFDAMHNPVVPLKSGGHIVINPTEALVSIDVNSGRATKERNIEETALRTNLEAAEELARQLRLRDLSGLIVIDFIDMEASKNNRAVERRLKDCLKADRARIEVGRISPFGLLEMSRQRLRPSLLEASSKTCPHCAGTGTIRSTESSTLHVLRAIEEAGLSRQGGEIDVHVATPVALYLLNFKRAALAEIEQRYQLTVFLVGDDALVPPETRIERRDARDTAAVRRRAASTAVAEVSEEVEGATAETKEDAQADEAGRKRRPRARRRKRGHEEAEGVSAEAAAAEDGAEAAAEPEGQEIAAQAAGAEAGAEKETETPRKRRRRGKRGGRRRSATAKARETAETATVGDARALPEEPAEAEAGAEPESKAKVEKDEQAGEKPIHPPRGQRSRGTKKARVEMLPAEGAEVEHRPADESPAKETAPEAELREAASLPQPSGAQPEAEQASKLAGNGEATAGTGAPEQPKQVTDQPMGAPEPTTEMPEEVMPVAAAPAEKPTEGAPAAASEQGEEAPKRPVRRGWWRRPTV